MTHWTEFGLSNRPPLVAREPIAALPPPLQALAAQWEASMAEPVTGIRNGPELQPGLFPLHATGVSTQPMLDAALAFLDALPATQRAKAVFPMDANQWRTWLNMRPRPVPRRSCSQRPITFLQVSPSWRSM